MDIHAALWVSVFGLIILVKRTPASEYQRSHRRDAKLIFANFVKHTHKILSAKAVHKQKVSKASVCAFNCLNHNNCSSYNVASSPDAKGNYECQLLAIDKYVNPAGLKYSAEFNHYSVQSPCESSPCQNGGICLSEYKMQTYKCQCVPGFAGKYCSHLVTSCKDLMDVGEKIDGVYTIRPDEQGPLKVYCDQTTDGGGWTVLQRRVSPFNTSFKRGWEEYRTGFGNLTGEFWLGNDNIHRLTATPVSFRIDYLEKGNTELHARYENFVVAGADDKYRWDMDSYSDGGLGNAIYGSGTVSWREKGMQFSTPDNDNDGSPTNCALSRSSGWWYNYCGLVDLNGAQGPNWSRTVHSVNNIITSYSDMKVRPP